MKRRIIEEFRKRGRKRPGRKPTGRVTHYLLDQLRAEGRHEEADALFPFATANMLDAEKNPKTEYISESRHIQRYKARKAREREAREILRGHSEKAKAERNEEVKFVVCGEILQRAEEVAKESGLSVGEMCRVILASIAGVGIEQRMGPAQAVYPFWRLNGKI